VEARRKEREWWLGGGDLFPKKAGVEVESLLAVHIFSEGLDSLVALQYQIFAESGCTYKETNTGLPGTSTEQEQQALSVI
jgi:hypothetical protein